MLYLRGVREFPLGFDSLIPCSKKYRKPWFFRGSGTFHLWDCFHISNETHGTYIKAFETESLYRNIRFNHRQEDLQGF